MASPYFSTPSNEELLQEYNKELRNTVLPVTVLFGFEILFGICGNLLTFYVFFFHYKPCNFRYFVLCLALIDLTSCLTTIPGEIVSQIFWYDYPVPPVCKIKSFFNQFTVCAEAACLAVIAVDRYRKVCQPFGWQIKKHTSIRLCVAIIVLATLLAIPVPVLWGVHKETVLYKGRNITVTVCEKDEKYRHTKLPFASIVFNQSLVFLTLICMFVLYIFVAKKLIIGQRQIKRYSVQSKDELVESSTDSDNKADQENVTYRYDPCYSPDDENAEQNTNSNTKKPELTNMVKVRRKTMIMFYLTIIFIITTILYGVLISVVANGILTTLSDSEKVLYFFFLRLYFINHVINPLLYGIMDPAFRKEMRNLRTRIIRLCSR